jgi:hypothetical protein
MPETLRTEVEDRYSAVWPFDSRGIPYLVGSGIYEASFAESVKPLML